MPRLTPLLVGLPRALILARAPADLSLASAAPATGVPRTAPCLTDRVHQCWHEHGGLPLFGYPLTLAQLVPDPAAGQVRLT